MNVFTTVAAMQAEAEQARQAGRRLGLVPTMGALHEAHLALVRTAAAHANHLTVSIFVNPTQFGPGEDFEHYPRPIEDDLAQLDALGCVDAVFLPSPTAMYPVGKQAHHTWVTVEGLDAHLCGAHRPGHFQGVTTIVTKLFNVCKPHVACFGLKDVQQFMILRRMVIDLNIDVEMIGVPTQRAPDGLALSSRNRYLSPQERAEAVVLSQAVAEARARIEAGERRTATLVEAMQEKLAEATTGRVQYAEVVEAEHLQPSTHLQPGQEVIAAVAVFFGSTRLIDNTFATVGS